MEKYATVSWNINDVMSAAEESGIVMTVDEARQFLEKYHKSIQEKMVNAGWDAISFYVEMLKYEVK